MYISRILTSQIEKSLYQGKTIIIYGARQVGKTTLVQDILSRQAGLYYTGDLAGDRDIIKLQDPNQYRKIFGSAKLVIIDEAQRIENIGMSLKIIHDYVPEVQVIATGSSSFDIANKVSEPLTGRTIEYTLYPLSGEELMSGFGDTYARPWQMWLRYGTYPGIVGQSTTQAESSLRTLASNYLYRDLLEHKAVKKPAMLEKLLKLLALQIGSQVSYHELATQLGISLETVNTYIDLLEKSFVIFRLYGYSRNLRKEISKSPKIYFYDIGVRNALIDQFQPLENRSDAGALWENWCIVERLKYLRYHGQGHTLYFWRTYDGQEVDLLEDFDGQMLAWEMKWNPLATAKVPPTLIATYPQVQWKKIDQTNLYSQLVLYKDNVNTKQ